MPGGPYATVGRAYAIAANMVEIEAAAGAATPIARLDPNSVSDVLLAPSVAAAGAMRIKPTEAGRPPRRVAGAAGV
jgi:hypothetical protein